MILFIAESFGAVHHVLVKALHALGMQTRLDTTEASIQYGTARARHLAANISASVVYDDAQTPCLAGDATCYMPTIGLDP